MLDEGHIIRSKNTNQSKAAFMLEAESRFIISGTPLQNSLTDLYCLVKFLRFGSLADISIWNGQIDRKIRRGDKAGTNRLKVLMKTIWYFLFD